MSDKRRSDCDVTAIMRPFLEKMIGDLNPDSSTSWNLHAAVVEPVEKILIQIVLQRTRNNKVRAARMLGMHRNTLYKKIEDLKIDS